MYSHSVYLNEIFFIPDVCHMAAPILPFVHDSLTNTCIEETAQFQRNSEAKTSGFVEEFRILLYLSPFLNFKIKNESFVFINSHFLDSNLSMTH